MHAFHFDFLDNDVQKYLETAFWSEDGEKIYYAFSLEPTDINETRTLHWRAYEVQSGVSITLTEAPKITRTVVEPVLFASYPEIQTLRSPSGRYTLEQVAKEAEEKTEIWLHDMQEQKWIKILDTCLVCYIYRVEWFRDESKVIFDIAYHTGGEYYVTDIQTGDTELLCQPEDIYCWIHEERITLSPDGGMLAGLSEIGGQYQIRIDRLADRDSVFINEVASQITWSHGGKKLYYWYGFYDQRNSELRAYDITKGRSSTVFDKSMFEEYGICFNEFGFDYCNFDVSPSGDQFIFWIEGPIDGNIWIVTLP